MSNQAEFHAANSKRSDSAEGASSTTPNVRHIPIFVEGRDEPLINRHNDHHSSSGHSPASNQHSSSSTTATQTKRPTTGPSPNPFDWSRKFSAMGGQQSSATQTGPTQTQQPPPNRSDSPHRTIPISHSAPPSAHHQHATPTRPHPYAHSQSDGRITPDAHQQQKEATSNNFPNASPQPKPQQQQQQQPKTPQQQQTSRPAEQQYTQSNSGAPDVSFTKITQIQCDVLELMDQVSKAYRLRMLFSLFTYNFCYTQDNMK